MAKRNLKSEEIFTTKSKPTQQINFEEINLLRDKGNKKILKKQYVKTCIFVNYLFYLFICDTIKKYNFIYVQYLNKPIN